MELELRFCTSDNGVVMLTGATTYFGLAVTGVIPPEPVMEADVLFAGALASQEANQVPMDLAFLAAAKERHIFDNAQGVGQSSALPL